jgi:hypothetical protein
VTVPLSRGMAAQPVLPFAGCGERECRGRLAMPAAPARQRRVSDLARPSRQPEPCLVSSQCTSGTLTSSLWQSPTMPPPAPSRRVFARLDAEGYATRCASSAESHYP